MSVYYVQNKFSEKYNTSDFLIGSKTIAEIKEIIKSTPNFCREEKSIERTDLISYLSSGITIYTLNEIESLSGVLNFNINYDSDLKYYYIKIDGLCVPGISSGIGSALLTSVKNFARSNSITQIKLSCYDEQVMHFYMKNSFRLVSESTVLEDSDYDSDSDSDTENRKIKYNMLYTIESGGKKRKTIRKRKILKKRKTIRKKKYYKKNRY